MVLSNNPAILRSPFFSDDALGAHAYYSVSLLSLPKFGP